MKTPVNTTLKDFVVDPTIIDTNGKHLFGYFVGTVETVTNVYKVDDHMECDSDLSLAYQLESGSIVCLDRYPDSKPQKVRSLKGELYSIWWGVYPRDFPEEWKAILPTPVAKDNKKLVEELPF